MTAFEKRILAWVVVGCAFAAWAWVNEESFKDDVAQEKHTCEMVAGKHWPEHQARNLDCTEQNVVGVRG